MFIEEIKKNLVNSIDKLNEFQRQLTAFFSTLPDPIFILNKRGEYIEVLGGNNNKLYDTGKHLKGLNLFDVFKKHQAEKFLEAIEAALSSGEMVTIEYQLELNKVLDIPYFKESDWFQGRIMPINEADSNSTESVLWTAINITEKKQLELQLKELAEKDMLTGLYTRRVMTERLIGAYSYLKRYGTRFAVIYADLDKFKTINDEYGHSTGDEVIKGFSHLLSGHLRANDFASRYGGEEFLILLPESDPDGAMNFAEILRRRTEQHSISSDQGNIKFTVSIGVSLVNEEDKSFDDVIERADKALYEAKKSGRNKAILK